MDSDGGGSFYSNAGTPSAGYLANLTGSAPTPAMSQPPSRAPSSDSMSMTGDDEDPRELDDDDLDPINSGVQTPQQLDAAGAALGGTAAQRQSKALNFLKKRETKVVKGVTYNIVDDELMLDDDPRGEAKVDQNGALLGGRQFKLHTFTSPMRPNPDKLYMLSIDAARAAGYRDSLYFFRRNPLVHKISCAQSEKDRLIDMGKLNSNLKSRAVTMVSARNVFKVMGATCVRHGKYVFDDYYEDKSLAAGHTPGEPAYIETYDPGRDSGALTSAKASGPSGSGSQSSKSRLNEDGTLSGGAVSQELASITGASRDGRSSVFGSVGRDPFYARAEDDSSTSTASTSHAKKPKPLPPHLTQENWMFEYARAAREANAELLRIRSVHVGPVRLSANGNDDDPEAWTEAEVEVEETDTDEQEEDDDGDEEDDDEADDFYRQLRAANGHGGGGSALDGLASAAALLDGGAGDGPSHHQAQNLYQNSNQHAVAPLSTPAPSKPTITFKSSSANQQNLLTAAYTSDPRAQAQSQFQHQNQQPAPPAPAPPKPPKVKTTRRVRRTTRVAVDLKGFYDPETNVPHVYRATQPNWSTGWQRVSVTPAIFAVAAEEEDEGDGDEMGASKRTRLSRIGDAARKAGIASVEYVVVDDAGITSRDDGQEEKSWRNDLLPGMWDFEAGEAAVLAAEAEGKGAVGSDVPAMTG